MIEVFPQMSEVGNKRVQVCSRPEFWKFIQEKVTGRTHVSCNGSGGSENRGSNIREQMVENSETTD